MANRLTRRVILLIAAAAMVSPVRADAPKPARSVLFIGNSLTFGANVPQVTEAMLVAKRTPFVVNQHTIGAATLGSLWNQKDAEGADARMQSKMSPRQKIVGRKWGFVVLQDQSMLPAARPPDTLKHAKLFCDAIHARGSIPVFYATWGYDNDPEMLDKLTATYLKAAKDNNAILAPVGLAFVKAGAADKSIELFMKDGIHASLHGGYLAACVFYAAMSGESPVGLPAKMIGKNRSGKRAIVANVPPAVAKTLQQAAWDAINEMHEKNSVPTTIKHVAVKEASP